jgi:drug/metabolite transporter (DMT)-like permease
VALSNAAKADLYLVIVTLLAAISWIFSREAVLLMPPLLFMALRFLLAGLLLAAIGYRELSLLNREACLRAMKVGIVFGAGMSCWVMGLFLGKHVGEGAFLTSLGVVLVPIISRIVFGERQPRSIWYALPVATAGLALLSLKNGFHPEIGQIFYVVAAAIFALYFTLNTRAANAQQHSSADGAITHQKKIPALPLTAIVLTTVGLLTTLLSLAIEPWQPTFMHFTAEMAWWILASVVLGSAARFLLQTHAQSLSTHSHGVVILVIEPVWVALLAAGWFGETMTAIQLTGCALIFVSLLINRAGLIQQWLRGLF